MPRDTDQVYGVVSGGSDQDWFQFQNLAPNTSFQLRATFNPTGAETGLTVAVYNSSQALLATQTLEYFISQSPLNGTVPSDGRLDVKLSHHNVSINNNGGYSVNLNAALATPEPGTLATAGLALAGALAWRRKRRK
ncbi:MAG TPA: PEP-CTERM sorting domain-containing protein [Bryobacteraceae bacterium]|nr:PEP-CTERM sorting domain-containing protein [Bryobacteraceae bacterium]